MSMQVELADPPFEVGFSDGIVVKHRRLSAPPAASDARTANTKDRLDLYQGFPTS
jgi:hypothetical protein